MAKTAKTPPADATDGAPATPAAKKLPPPIVLKLAGPAAEEIRTLAAELAKGLRSGMRQKRILDLEAQLLQLKAEA